MVAIHSVGVIPGLRSIDFDRWSSQGIKRPLVDVVFGPTNAQASYI